MRPIDNLTDVEAGLDALCAADTRLVAVRAAAGTVPLRRVSPGFASLCAIVVGQQVSTASAAAINARFERLVDPVAPAGVLAASDELFREAGFSAAKVRTVRAAAREVEAGLDLYALLALPAAEAVARLTAIPGIGPWTAELYLLFAGGHPDVFPARDVALQAAVAHGLGLPGRPGEKALTALAASWQPWRGVAARLFWAYYRTVRGREGVAPGRLVAGG